MNVQFTKNKISFAILSALSLTTLGAFAAEEPAKPASNKKKIEVINVTATKQVTNMQAVPIAVQAINEEVLESQGITSFESYVKFLPNVSSGGRGPGQNEVYIRGAATQAINIAVAEANGSAPNVALYLDDAPITAGGRNIDLYVSDMERIEVLAGPQGTLFGASSQAGTVRLITNKPNVDDFDAKFKMEAATTKGGDMSSAVTGMINIPLIEGKLGVRAAFFNDSKGGFVDNVAGTFVPDSTKNSALPNNNGVMFVPADGDATSHEFADGTFAVPGKTYAVEHTPVNNAQHVEENFNDALYQGFRVGLSYIINDDWTFLIQHHQQTLDADGVFDYDPSLGDLKVQRYNPDTLVDEFGQTSWTVEGVIGELNLVYTGGYLSRTVDQKIDYTNYIHNGSYIAGYTCEYNTPGYHGGGGVGYTFDPTLSGDPDVIDCSAANGFINIYNENERFTHELRLSGDITDSIRFTTGVYYENSEIRHVGDFAYGNPEFASIKPANLLGGAGPNTANDVSERDPRVQFTNDITRPETQKSFFGEVTFDLTDTISTTLGYRYYNLEIGFEGFSAWKYGNRVVDNLAGEAGVTVAPDVTGGRDYEQNIGEFQPYDVSDSIVKANVSWKMSEDIMVFATYSEGYRPAGYNRAVASGQITASADGSLPTTAARGNGSATFVDQNGDQIEYHIPLIYDSDELNNYELGIKSYLFDGTLRFNASVYHIDWTNIQIGHVDNENISLFTVVDNAGDATIDGIEGDLIWVATDHLTLYTAFSYNDAKLESIDPGFGFAIVAAGSDLPLTPKFQANVRALYEWDTSLGLASFQVAAKFSGESNSSLIEEFSEKQDSYHLVDASVSLDTDNGWRAELYMDNITNERPELHINTQDGLRKITSVRPFTTGVRLTYRFE